MANKEKQLKLTLIKSLIGRNKKHQDTVKCLGLRRMHHSVTVNDIQSTRGMINQVSYMLNVEEV